MAPLNAHERLLEVAKEIGKRAQEESLENVTRLKKSLEWVEPAIDAIEHPTIVDIGCGLGVAACAMAMRKPATVYGLDKFLWETKSNANHFGLTEEEHRAAASVWAKFGVRVLEGDIKNHWPFENNLADLVTSNAVIEHLNGTHRAFVSEAYRILKPGGLFFLSTPNIAYILKRIRFLIGRSPNWDLKDMYMSEQNFTGHTREFTRDECVNMLQWEGFQIVRAEAVPTYGKWKWLRTPKKWPSLAAFILAHLSKTLGDHIFILARKPSENLSDKKD